jgi:hypothetical protein
LCPSNCAENCTENEVDKRMGKKRNVMDDMERDGWRDVFMKKVRLEGCAALWSNKGGGVFLSGLREGAPCGEIG